MEINMKVSSDQDFANMRKQFAAWRKRFPLFVHDVRQIERIVENHIQEYSRALVQYRQTHKKNYLEQAQKEIDAINAVLSTVAKLELMSMLSQR
jgi:hypothetical protein